MPIFTSFFFHFSSTYYLNICLLQGIHRVFFEGGVALLKYVDRVFRLAASFFQTIVMEECTLYDLDTCLGFYSMGLSLAYEEIGM